MVLQLNPLAYEKAFQEWTNANVKELRVTRFSGLTDLADSDSAMGHLEAEIKLKPKRGQSLGTFSGLFTNNSNEFRLVELLRPIGEQIKTVVEINGKRRTFNVGVNAENSVCQIELDSDVNIIDGLPELTSFHNWVNIILEEYKIALYPS